MTDRKGSARSGSRVRVLDYRVLGPVEVRAEGAATVLGGRKQRGVVAVLVAAAGRPVSVDSLLQAIYGDDAFPGSKQTLHTYVSNLRHVLGDVIVRHGDAYFLDCADALVDAQRFEELYRSAASSDDAESVSSQLRDALSLWRGHPYADIEAHGHLDGEITRLSELRLSALELRIDADMRSGRHREVVAELDALTVEHPFRENLRALHMLALYRSGRQAEALRAFGRTREVLVEGLGIDPSPELKALEQRILEQDRGLLISVGPIVQRRTVLVADLDDSGWHDPAEREIAFAERDSSLEQAAAKEAGIKLAPRGTAGYVLFTDPIHAVRAARAVVNERLRVAIDLGDLEMRDDEPVGPPLARAARLVAIAHPGQVLLSVAAHDALAVGAETGWAAESLGRFDIVGLDPGVHIYQLVGRGFTSDFPALRVDRLPPPVPGGVDRSVPGYELRQLLGVGQLGAVHRAYQPSVGREVALRVFDVGMVGHPQFVRRFETAAQRITRVEHPHVVPLLDYWREPNRAVMVSRLVTGGHLRERIPAEGLDPARAVFIFDAIASGLASAHRRGVVHGRIRPENVLFDEDGNAYLADLGIDEICAGVISFATGAYDAPERLGGVLATPAADIYSLGVLLHHMLGGAAPPSDSELPSGEGSVAAVITRATDSEPGRRHASVDELMYDLRHALAVPVDPASTFVPTRNPYRGLEAFERADAEDFFGRDRAVAEMVAVLEDERLLVVVGPSGIGKSSVVKAGLLPAFGAGAIAGSEGWLVTELVPGREPFDRLAAALERIATTDVADVVGQLTTSFHSLSDVVDQLVPSGAGVVIVIDQLEELFTQTVDDAERRAFLRMIAGAAQDAASDVRLVVTLRADYFDRPLSYPGFGDAIRGRTVALGAMSASELSDAVRLPAAAVGVVIEPALVERIVADAEVQPGGLPLVQHTMAELFEGRQTSTVTLGGFDNAGGLAGAIGRRAEAIYESLDERGREVAPRVFLRLVSVSEDHEDTRRRVRRSELEQSGVFVDDLETVLAEYGRYRLLTFDRDPATRTPTVELAHEALLTDWERYKGWIDEAREDLLTRRRLETAAHDWAQAGSEASFLYRGGRLELAESWAATSGFELSEAERGFLAASRTKADRDRVTRRRRRRLIVVLLSAAVVAATVMAGVAVVQRGRADRQADETRARELAGLAQLAVAEDPERAILLALAATEKTNEPLPEAVSALQQATQSMRLLVTVDGETGASLDQSPDGSLIAIDRIDGFDLIDPVSGQTVERITTDHHTGTARVLSFAPSGTTLALAYNERADETMPAIERFDIPSGRLAGSLPGPAGDYDSVAHDPSGRWLGAIRDDPQNNAELVVWDIAAGGLPRSLGPAWTFQFIPGTDSVIVLDLEKPLAVLDVATGEVIREIDLPDDVEYFGLEIDPTGRMVALIAPRGRRVDIIDVASGDIEKSLKLPGPTSAKFGPDGKVLAIGGNDHLVRLFDTETFDEIRQLAGTPRETAGLAFSPDGSRLVSATVGQVRAWDLSPEGPTALGNFHVSGGLSGLLSADASAAVVDVYTNSSIHRVDLDTGEDAVVVADLDSFAITPDLLTAAVLDGDRSKLVDLATGREKTEFGECEAVNGLDPSGRFVVIDGQTLCTIIDGPAQVQGSPTVSRVVDVRTGRTLVDLGNAAIWGSVFGPPVADGAPGIVAVIQSLGGRVTVYELAGGTELGSYQPDAAFPLNLAIDGDGTRLVLTMDTGQLVVLDLDRLASSSGGDAIVWTADAHAGSIPSLSISAGGWIATASHAGNARVWSPDGELVGDFPLRLDDSPSVAFAEGTETLYYEDGGAVFRRFSLDADERARVARSLLTRGFTAAECARYFPGERCPAFVD